MDLHKNQLPTTSSPPPVVITPTGSKYPDIPQPTEVAPVTTSAPLTSPTTATTKSVTTEIKAPAGVTPGVPLSELKNVVRQQQNQQKPDATIGVAVQPNRALEVGLVGVQLVALFVVIFGFIPPLLWQNTLLQVLGMLLIGLALFVGIWAVLTFKQKISILPSPNPSGFLVTGGPFAYIRHPLYFSLLAASIGLMLAYPTIPRLLALVVLGFVLYVKMNYEEARLAERYNGYEKYALHTGRLLPKVARKQTVNLAQPPNADQADKER